MARLDRRMATLEGALMEAQQAAATVQELGEAKGPLEAMVPLGGGVHVRARIDPQTPVLLPVGAGYSTEAAAAQVADALRARVDALAAQLRDTGEEANRVANAAAALNEQLQALQ